MKKLFGIVLIQLISSWQIADAQLLHASQTFTHADTLRGTYGPTRDWWDVLKYDIHVRFHIEDSTLGGYNTIQFKVLKKGSVMQIDLQEPLVIDSVVLKVPYSAPNNETSLSTISRINDLKKDGNAYFISFTTPLSDKNFNELTIYYHGKPVIAKLPPWDGGMIWKKDKYNNPWVSIACQGLGASVWYPCKDHQADEPDQAEMHITCPDTLVAVGNGRLRDKKNNGDGTVTYDWVTTSPINNYCIIPYIGKYVHFGEVYKGEKGDLDMDYWVLEQNLDKAKKHFTEAPKMMKAFEYWFGPYPFYEDSYKLVDAPHLGMEHQSATAYGNQYRMGYLGTDRSGSGWGLKWDYIIVHESGHEWFANNISTKDIADMWVHEGFTCYSETLYTEYYYGKDAANAYCVGGRTQIDNAAPVIGKYDVNKESPSGSDMYEKGANMIHTIRQVIDNDTLFRKILRGLNSNFYHQTVTGSQVEEYINEQSHINFSKVFDQYLRTANIPVLEYKIDGYTLNYRWTNCIQGFNMPLKVNFKGRHWIKPTEKWQTMKVSPGGDKNFFVDTNFYIKTKKVD